MKSEQLSKLKQYYEHVTDGVFFIGNDGSYLDLNPAAQRITGYTPKEFQRLTIFDLLQHIPAELCSDFWQKFIKTKNSIEKGQTPIIIKNNQLVNIRWTYVSQIVDGISIAIWHDLTDIDHNDKATGYYLSNASSTMQCVMINQTVATIANEINQPLSAIVNYAFTCEQLYKKTPVDHDKIKECLSRLSISSTKAGHRMHKFIELTRSKIPALERRDIDTILSNVAIYFKDVLALHNVHLSYKISNAACNITCEPIFLEQIFCCLIKNSIEALQDSDKKIISINVDRDDDHIIFRYFDTGHGIPEELKEKIFSPFFSTKNGNSGIGMTIIHSLVEAALGRFTIDESEQDKGASFTLSIPFDPENALISTTTQYAAA